MYADNWKLLKIISQGSELSISVDNSCWLTHRVPRSVPQVAKKWLKERKKEAKSNSLRRRSNSKRARIDYEKADELPEIAKHLEWAAYDLDQRERTSVLVAETTDRATAEACSLKNVLGFLGVKSEDLLRKKKVSRRSYALTSTRKRTVRGFKQAVFGVSS